MPAHPFACPGRIHQKQQKVSPQCYAPKKNEVKEKKELERVFRVQRLR